MQSERCSLVVHEQLAPKRTFAKKKATTMSQITCSQQQQQSVCVFGQVFLQERWQTR